MDTPAWWNADTRRSDRRGPPPVGVRVPPPAFGRTRCVAQPAERGMAAPEAAVRISPGHWNTRRDPRWSSGEDAALRMRRSRVRLPLGAWTVRQHDVVPGLQHYR